MAEILTAAMVVSLWVGCFFGGGFIAAALRDLLKTGPVATAETAAERRARIAARIDARRLAFSARCK